MNNKDTSIKILIAYHKPADLLKSEIFIPIQTGRAVMQQKNKDGQLSSADHNWLLTNMIGDDTGENISALNRCFNEMTAVYWGWKNQTSLQNPDYIGLMHYRRHFVFNESYPLNAQTWLPESNIYCYPAINDDYKKLLDEKSLTKLCTQYDILCSKKYNASHLHDGKVYRNCKQRFAAVSQCPPEYYELMEQIVMHDYPQYKNEIQQLAQEPSHYLCNMFVMKTSIFNQYCNFIFDVLFKIYDSITIEQASIWQMRCIGYLAEFLTSIFISDYKAKHPQAVKELDLTYINTAQTQQSTVCRLLNIIPLYSIRRRNNTQTHKFLGIPYLKIKQSPNAPTLKYSLFGLPLLKISRKNK